MKTTYDKELGLQIQKHLITKGLESYRDLNVDKSKQVETISNAYQEILTALRLTSIEFEKTPHRIARMFTQEIFYGLDYGNFPACGLYENEFRYDGILTQKHINIMSFCEHHFVPFEGTAEVSFIPKDNNIIGLCRINSICDFFSRRPQIQERMTAQIFETLKFILKTEDVSVKITAKHTCVSFRGKNNKDSETFTQMTGGHFKK
ncbi:GTP cyclohydrolase I FolE [Allofrancisella guangzhouensis]|uniref:GTP cyclohydrolase I n=1 Tax=Allofrancisella guangzhouensis TaxID=594679 RepID=A0A0A8E4D1_9GAMM|nr:GTP cyclohydrolase I FolE [Allofrancisella guangzhouensis]AJC49055.1 GTP cyclohydrolase [Allofrancisella guangzhouensis]MBK2027455.1 GTP cyclohydrolase I FolE [Allofrancisella guangzhouensis]MBK2044114.1 GTP cyclohydrolase I FolE [Allofrancisella guangzhouensis]MBK2045457.1 GTP cyclohydrolase I FolE [Allofrancisella guangzhouensis]